jgi:glutathione S-transferase
VEAAEHISGRSARQLPELYQTEWCPASRRVRQRLTELDVAYVARHVPVERAERTELWARTGSDSIPALVSDDGSVLVGEEEIRLYLDARFPEPAGAEAHRLKAIKAHMRELEEAGRWLEPSTH